jgi:transcriptional regulator with XRE-family HTH domain
MGGGTVQDEEPFALLGAEMRRRRLAAGLSQDRLAVRVGSDQAMVSKTECARKFPPGSFVEAVDDALAADGALVDLYAAAWRARQGKGRTAGRGEEDETDRRTFVGGLAAAALVAAETSRQIARADPDPLTLAEVEDDVDRFAQVYATTGHDVLLPPVRDRWSQVDRALAGRTTLTARHRLTLAAGRLSYFLSRLSFGVGDHTSAQRFGILARQYAEQTGDEVVLASVVGIQSGIAYYRQRYDTAIEAYAGRGVDPPYLRARGAAYRARAYGRLGDERHARAELDVMRRTMRDDPPQPGDLPLTEAAAAMFTASALSSCGVGEEAEPWARGSIRGHQAAGGAVNREEWAHALLTLASALLTRPRPVIDEAAVAASSAVRVIEGAPVHTVIERTAQIAGSLEPHRRVPEVAALRAQVAAAPRRALPA